MFKYVFIGITIIGIYSCSKSSSPKAINPKYLFTKWSFQYQAWDSNRNGSIDNNEIYISTVSTGRLNINSNGTGFSTYISLTTGDTINYPLTWMADPDTTYLIITYPTLTIPTVSYHIDSLTNSRLVWKDTLGDYDAWGVFNKY